MAASGSGEGGDIGANSERRIKKALDKLYKFPKPKTSSTGSKPSSSSSSASASSFARAGTDAARRFGVVRGSRLPPQVAAMSALSPPPPCRPWDRADLMRRLTSFKAMTWFAKPKVISPVNCARRGWINIEPDVITCEACGARLLFSTPSSWTTQQVEKAAAVFSLKLDTGHKLLCPWIDNICDESLALFPPTPPPVLVENYYECFSSLLRLTALPRISSSSLEVMKKRTPQLEQFLSEPLSSSVVLKGKFVLTEDSTVKDLDDAFEDAGTYYQALKIISLCGWGPRILSYAIDCGTESHPDANSTAKLVRQEQISKSVEDRVILYSPNDVNRASASAGSNQEDEHYDPLSVVLDCQFCGACVALWPFSLVERPLQLFNLVSDSRQDDQDNGHANLVSGVEPSKSANIGFNFTIAGGPPPTRQSFRPKVSLPIVSRHLKADLNSRGIFHSSGSDSHMVPDALHASGPLKRKRSIDQPLMLEDDHTTSNNADTSSKETNHEQPGDDSARSTSNMKVSTEQKQGGSHSDTDKGTNVCEASNEQETTSSLVRKSTDATLEQQRPEHKSPPAEGARVETSDAVNLTETQTNSSLQTEVGTLTKSFADKEKGACKPSEKHGLYDRLNEFDPIKQHRTFCPWIAPDNGESLSGWRLTLSALLAQDKGSDGASRVEVQTSFLDEEEDPVTSVRKLFMSPPPKRLRLHQSEMS